MLPVRITGESYLTAFYISADGGMSWQLANIVPGVGSLRVLPGGGIIFFDGEHFHVTKDVNSDWTLVTPDISFTNAFARMDFVDLNTGWVLTYVDELSRPFYQTIDGGQTWTLLIP